MSSAVTADTFIRKLSQSTLRKLSDFLDPQDAWKTVLVDIQKPTGEPRYSQLHLRRFERLVAQGKSPTVELLYDWGTTNSTVGELVEILVRHKLLAPARVLLPDIAAPPAATNSRREAEDDPSTKFYQEETALCGGILTKAAAVEETLYTPPDSTTEPEENQERNDEGFYTFTYKELTQITGSWDDRPVSDGGRKLGEGGFGTVFKGLLYGTPVAVKKLNLEDDLSPEELKTQFKQEIQTLTRLKHVNLVNMVGYSSDGQHPCLVYAYMPNGSLLDRLACLAGSTPLSWRVRCAIALGTARGLEYLHQHNHIHRDVKSGNILLDELFIAKISDFGLTRASAKHSCTTVITERIVGTTAYMAPEALRGEITPKSDVFSFGVVLLEIVSGLPPVEENRDPKLLIEMKHEIEDEEITLEEFVDKRMEDWDMESVEKMFTVASQCLKEGKNRRPQLKEVCVCHFSTASSIFLSLYSYCI
ncbi:interleukin-1 receptor-associated kinase 4 isoform X1 [Pygocentrus nattereri]|uniref:Interleukin-1 receptor-associated kinase 4 n=1 Tax=Pygocentrus nattereri TaxID=42514 RepID=A0AAR2LBW1_PYGNA|nr:interleukin-1 receptor-associated kinase 4 isoform X1 [Pygocentrus nattereri]